MKFPRGVSHWMERVGAGGISIDLGTANTLVYMKGKGIVANEPSVVAVRPAGGGKQEIVAVGREAKALVGKAPPPITTIRPLKEGVIADFDLTKAMLGYFMRKSQGERRLLNPHVVISLPHDATDIEKRAVEEAGYSIGARKIHLIEEPIAAALGADLPVLEPVGSMIVDIGGGTTEVAVVSLAGIVCCRSVRVGGDAMDERIMEYMKRKHNILIGERTAEQLKIALGTAWPDEDRRVMRMTGRDILTGLPQTVEVTSTEIGDAISSPLNAIIDAIKAAFADTPPELAGDILEKGIVVTGGGALIKNIDIRLRHETGLPIVIDQKSLLSVALGGGKALEDPDLLRAISMN